MSKTRLYIKKLALVLLVVSQSTLGFSQETLVADGSQSGAVNIAVLDNEKRSIKQTFFSPKIGLSYHTSKQSNLYGKVSRAYIKWRLER